jgi:hypothetical protein
MPVYAANCRDIRTFNRAETPAPMRWVTDRGRETLPTYPPLPEPGYFDGTGGLPISGPLGRCLTSDYDEHRVITSECDGRLQQNWKLVGSAIHLGMTGDCLERRSTGDVRTAVCNGKADQQWRYSIAAPDPGPSWISSDVYGQILAANDATKCLVVREDPFVDPARYRNPVQLGDCTVELSRKTSWFIPDNVYTIRMAVVRYSDDDGSNAAMGQETDDAVKAQAEALATYLSDYYRAVGFRFAFDPAHDLVKIRNTQANQTPGEADQRIQQVAGTEAYGKAVISAMLRYGGGSSCGILADYDHSQVINDPRNGRIRDPNDPMLQYAPDRAGLASYCRVVNESFISSSLTNVGHEAHEFGHFFGLGHTFERGRMLDTPHDTVDGSWWTQHGGEGCGNARTGYFKGVQYTPDRINNESYWGCLIGRSHTAFSPQQLGRMRWSLTQLNRYPLVACQPLSPYDANHVECENTESLDLCRETASYLKAKNGTELDCKPGGAVTRATVKLLRKPAINFVLQNTPEGQTMMKRLAGVTTRGQLPLPTLAKVIETLQSCANLPICLTLIRHFDHLEALAVKQTPTLQNSGFAAGGPEVDGRDHRLLSDLAKQIFVPGFVDSLPVIIR